MKFSIDNSIEILSATPFVLEALLSQLSSEWINNNEGENTWSPIEIVIHLINGEKTNWVPRMNIILSDIQDKAFDAFVRMEENETTNKKNITNLLNEFKEIRFKNIAVLKSKHLNSGLLKKTGIHPAFGQVILSQLIATWTLHDLNHLSQISRVLAKQYKDEVGPWKQFLPILGNK